MDSEGSRAGGYLHPSNFGAYSLLLVVDRETHSFGLGFHDSFIVFGRLFGTQIGSKNRGGSMRRLTLKQVAQVATGIAVVALLAGQWALITGPMSDIAEQGHTAAANGHIAEFAGIFGLNVLLTAALPLVFGGIGICVLAAYLAFERMLERQAQAGVIVEHGEY